MYPIVTAHDAFDEGIHPGELFRAARLNAAYGKHNQAAAIRKVGYELANIIGMRLRYRGAANSNHKRRGGEYDRQHFSQSRNRRAA